MKRGFKTSSERKAIEMRRKCGLPPLARLPADQLAAALNIPVLAPTEIPGCPEELSSKMICECGGDWSAVTVFVEGRPLIIYNCAHLPERRESDLMHELAHLLCEHVPGRIEDSGRLPWVSRTFNAEQEDEAAYLGGCLQIPRESLLRLLSRRYDEQAIATHFGASIHMVRYRKNITGVTRQLAYWHS